MAKLRGELEEKSRSIDHLAAENERLVQNNNAMILSLSKSVNNDTQKSMQLSDSGSRTGNHKEVALVKDLNAQVAKNAELTKEC